MVWCEVLRREAEDVADLVGQRLEEPDVHDRDDQLDVAHPLAAHFLLGHLYPATVADNAFISDALVFTTMTLPVLHWTKDSLTEQTAHFRLVSSIIDSLWLGYLTI